MAKSKRFPPALARGGRYWPKDQPLPTAYRKVRHEPLPCPKCRRVRLDNLGQAVVCVSSGAAVAAFRCKACGKTFKMAVSSE